MEEQRTGELTDEELENVDAGMCIGGTSEYDVDGYLNQNVIKNGTHSTYLGTCRLCKKLGILDKYVWNHTVYPGARGVSSHPSEDTVVICRACGRVPVSTSIDPRNKSSGC